MKELPKAYEPKTVDSKWYAFWEKHRFFQADPKSGKPPFCVVIPPPNVTGALHMGHALGNTLEDTIVRWKRMSGFETLWVPGTDHAGISTQTIVEKHLINTQGKRRADFSREEFLKHVWSWKEDNEGKILNQLKRLGNSCDWSRQRFTMDAANNRAVRKVFKLLFDKGLIYRGDYLVNWDPVTQTAIADDEVEYEERNSFLWYFKYPLANDLGEVRIATTRPETMLGDTAVAVHPDDPVHNQLIGKMVLLPLTDREIPVIGDPRVDPEFGTGMVKVTPAHDPNDYEMGNAHRLEFINIMTPDGKINENGGKFTGMTMQQAREAVVKEMDSLGLVEKIEPHVNRVGLSYRSKAVVEPCLSKQWFVKMSPIAPKLREAVQEEKVALIPKNWENTYYHWIDNLRDWCISRQLWWGHRIPIWYRVDDPEQMICHEGEGIPPEVEQSPESWRQDEDVLDTWFSSALWPFAALGWPDKTDELETFYPNSTMITGHDILFFWVARMIMMGEVVMGEVPFPECFLTSLIFGKSYWREGNDGISYVSEKERIEYDLGKPVPKDVKSKWEKMSKSKGNIIDPLEMIDMYGTDAVRMALCASASHSWELDLDRRRFEEFKNFANKVWNGARFIFLNIEELDSSTFSEGLDRDNIALEDKWLLSILNRVSQDVNQQLEGYHFDQAAMEAYDFYWKDFCSYYLEIVKPALFGKQGNAAEKLNKQKLLVIALCTAIRLMHPMAPFITEELFQLLKERFSGIKASGRADPYTKAAIEALNSPACIVSPYPQVIDQSDIDPKIEEEFALASKVVYTVRNIRGEMKIPPGTSTAVHIVGEKSDPSFSIVQQNLNIIDALIRSNSITLHEKEPKIGFCSTGIVEGIKVIIPMPQELQEQEMNRLEKEKERITAAVEKFETQLQNKQFREKAPAELVERQEANLEDLKNKLEEIDRKLASFAEG